MRFVGQTADGLFEEDIVQHVAVQLKKERVSTANLLTMFSTYTSSRLWLKTQPKHELAQKQIALDILVFSLEEQPLFQKNVPLHATLAWDLHIPYYEFIRPIFECRDWIIEKDQVLNWVYDYIQMQREERLRAIKGSAEKVLTYHEWHRGLTALMMDFKETTRIQPTLMWKVKQYRAGYPPGKTFIILLAELGLILYQGKNLSIDFTVKHEGVGKPYGTE